MGCGTAAGVGPGDPWEFSGGEMGVRLFDRPCFLTFTPRRREEVDLRCWFVVRASFNGSVVRNVDFPVSVVWFEGFLF